MNPVFTSWAQVAVIAGGYLLGIYFQNRSIAHLDKRIDDLRNDMTKRIDDLRADMANRFNDLRALIESEVKRIESRLERLERPLVRP
jgi:hypothetical protein